MKKSLFTASLFSIAVIAFNSPSFAQDNSEEAYDNAYYDCAEQADTDENNYDQVFAACMKSKGFSIELDETYDGEDGENNSSESEGE